MSVGCGPDWRCAIVTERRWTLRRENFTQARHILFVSEWAKKPQKLILTHDERTVDGKSLPHSTFSLFFCPTFSSCSARSLHSFHSHCVYVGKVSENPQNIFQKSLLSHFLHDAHKHPEMRGQMSFLSEVHSHNSLQFHEDENFIMPTTCLCCSKRSFSASFNEMRVISSEMSIKKRACIASKNNKLS